MRKERKKAWREYQLEIVSRIRGCLAARMELQSEFARSIGVSESLMCRYMNANRELPFKLLPSMAEHFGVKVSYLLGEGECEGLVRIEPFSCDNTARLERHIQGIIDGTMPIESVCRACGVGKKTLIKWADAYSAGGLMGLAKAREKNPIGRPKKNSI